MEMSDNDQIEKIYILEKKKKRYSTNFFFSLVLNLNRQECDWLGFILFVTPWTVARLAPVSMRFPRREYWSGVPLPSPGHLPDSGNDPVSASSPVLAGRFFPC